LGQDEETDVGDGATQASAMKSAEIAVLFRVGEGALDFPLPSRPCAGGSVVWKLLGARRARFPAPQPALCRWERGVETTFPRSVQRRDAMLMAPAPFSSLA
jgi:hypothetical protein